MRETENSLPETPDHIVEINNECIANYKRGLKQTKENLERLENGDYELCKEYREAHESRY